MFGKRTVGDSVGRLCLRSHFSPCLHAPIFVKKEQFTLDMYWEVRVKKATEKRDGERGTFATAK